MKRNVATRTARTLLIASSLLCDWSMAQQAIIAIKQVKIVLNADQKAQQLPGHLYRVHPVTSQRQWIAEVNADGRLSKGARCSQQDHLEVEIRQALAFPDDPTRLPCKSELVFSFTRPSFSKTPYKGTFVAAPVEKIDVVGLAELAGLSRAAGNSETARAASETVVNSTAIWLGDTKLEKFVKRDPARGFNLMLSDEGLNALAVKQKLLNIEPTGRIDIATQKAINAEIFKVESARIGTTYCSVARVGSVQCSGQRPVSSSDAVIKEVQIYHKF